MARSAVDGLDEFRRHLAGHEGAYALIGGVACDILLSDADLPFRATHDLDTVLVADGRLPETARALWGLIRDGGYRCGWGGNGATCFYRFTEPRKPGYPSMIELFSRTPGFLEGIEGATVAPFHIDDEISSLSAILLDEDYYGFLLGGIREVDGISVLGETHIIPFKARAYLDLERRRLSGEDVDSRKVKKHRRDALRLAQLLTGDEGIALPEAIRDDMRAFLQKCEEKPLDPRKIGIVGPSFADLVKVMRSAYGI